jgi:hypothetical protein
MKGVKDEGERMRDEGEIHVIASLPADFGREHLTNLDILNSPSCDVAISRRTRGMYEEGKMRDEMREARSEEPRF